MERLLSASAVLSPVTKESLKFLNKVVKVNQIFQTTTLIKMHGFPKQLRFKDKCITAVYFYHCKRCYLSKLIFCSAGGCLVVRQPDADRSCNPPCSQPHSYCSEVCVNSLGQTGQLHHLSSHCLLCMCNPFPSQQSMS